MRTFPCFFFALGRTLAIPECPFLPSSDPFTIDPRRVSLALVDYALAIARVETIQYNFLHRFLSSMSLHGYVAARVGRRHDCLRHLFPLPLVSTISDSHIQTLSPGVVKARQSSPALSISFRLPSFVLARPHDDQLSYRSAVRLAGLARSLPRSETLLPPITVSFRAACVLFPSYSRTHTSVD